MDFSPGWSLHRRSLLAGLAATATLPAARAVAAPPPASGIAYVGTYTSDGQGFGRGIHAMQVERGTGALRPLAVTEGIVNPSWLALTPNGRFLYALSEVEAGSVTAFAVAGGGKLDKLNTASSGGQIPAHLSIHPSGGFLLVANYGSGSVAVLPIRPDGTLGEPTDVQQGSGALNPPRAADNAPGNYAPSDHKGSHMHMVATDPAGRFVIANDAGLDVIRVWRLDPATGKLSPAAVPAVAATPGAAPRHFVFDRGGRYFFNLQEQDAMLVAYGYDAIKGGLARRSQIATLPKGFAGSNLAAELRLSADGRFLYASNRLRNAITIFSVTLDGRLALVDEVWCQSDYPRSFDLDPTGRFLHCCNQKGDSITSFAVDRGTGRLRFTGRFIPVPTPVAIVFS